MSAGIHMTRPGSTGSIFEDAPLWCGRPRSEGVHVTAFRHRATCKRCRKADELYAEDSEHRRTMSRLERERALTAGSIVAHSPDNSNASGTLCGGYSERDLIDSSAVTCPACLARTDTAHERATEQQSTPTSDTTMTDPNTDTAAVKPVETAAQKLRREIDAQQRELDAKQQELSLLLNADKLHTKLLERAAKCDVAIEVIDGRTTLSLDALYKLMELDIPTEPTAKKPAKKSGKRAAKKSGHKAVKKAAKKSGKKAAKKTGKKTTRAKKAVSDADKERVYKALAELGPGKHKAEEINCGLKGPERTAVLSALRKDDKINRFGEARGTKWSIR